MLTLVAQDAERALRSIEHVDGLLEDEQIKAAHELLRELIGQDFDIEEDAVPRLRRGTRSDRIISTVDTEMRHGRESSRTRFDGYKLSGTDPPGCLAIPPTATGRCAPSWPNATCRCWPRSRRARPWRIASASTTSRSRSRERDSQLPCRAHRPDRRLREGFSPSWLLGKTLWRVPAESALLPRSRSSPSQARRA
jgi:hypothetical protein